MSIDPRDLFVSLNPLCLDERELEKDSTGFADMRTHNDYLVFLAGYKAGAVDGEERECQRHRPMNAEGCKPDVNIQASSNPRAVSAACRSLYKAEGGTPDLNIRPAPSDMLELGVQHLEFIHLPDAGRISTAHSLQDHAYALGRTRGQDDWLAEHRQVTAALREDIARANRIQLEMALDLANITEALGIPPEEQAGGVAEPLAIIREMQDRLRGRDALLSDLLDHDISTKARERIEEAMRAESSYLTRSALDLLAERRRQIVSEGHPTNLDDEAAHGQLSRAAACYALSGACPPSDGTAALLVSLAWPWHESWWKPTNQRRDLVKAGALILAELERVDRQQTSEVQA